MSSEPEHEAVLATFKMMSDAWALMDAARFAACYANDATVIGPGIYLRGKDDINASMAAAFTGPLKHSLRPHSAQSLRFLSCGADAGRPRAEMRGACWTSPSDDFVQQ